VSLTIRTVETSCVLKVEALQDVVRNHDCVVRVTEYIDPGRVDKLKGKKILHAELIKHMFEWKNWRRREHDALVERISRLRREICVIYNTTPEAGVMSVGRRSAGELLRWEGKYLC